MTIGNVHKALKSADNALKMITKFTELASRKDVPECSVEEKQKQIETLQNIYTLYKKAMWREMEVMSSSQRKKFDGKLASLIKKHGRVSI